MKLWLDAQLSPEMASWIVKQLAVEAVPVRDVGLRDATDVQIFEAGKQADVVLVTKDSDFSHLIERLGRASDHSSRPEIPEMPKRIGPEKAYCDSGQIMTAQDEADNAHQLLLDIDARFKC